MQKSKILNTVIEHLIEESDLDNSKEDIFPETDLREGFDLDSMQSISMIMDIEEKYNISIDDDEMSNVQTIDDLVNIIDKKLSELGEEFE